ncbi:MAG: hypothetical protein J6Q82_07300 [Clostridia bacterium]|nr:hypothetical protein [Clostridia bacterium]
MKKILFLLKNASMVIRVIALIAAIAGIVSIVTLSTGVSSALNKPITELPLVTMIMDEAKLKQMELESKELSAEIEAALQEQDAAEIAELEKEFGISANELKESVETISLNSLSTVFQAEGDQEIAGIISGLIKGISVYGTVIAVLMALAVVFMKKGLMITAYIFALPIVFLLIGGGALMSITVATVVHFVLLTIVNRKYKAFKRAE